MTKRVNLLWQKDNAQKKLTAIIAICFSVQQNGEHVPINKRVKRCSLTKLNIRTVQIACLLLVIDQIRKAVHAVDLRQCASDLDAN